MISLQTVVMFSNANAKLLKMINNKYVVNDTGVRNLIADEGYYIIREIDNRFFSDIELIDFVDTELLPEQNDGK